MKQLPAFIAILVLTYSCNNGAQPATTNSTLDSAAMPKEAMLAKNKLPSLAQAFNSHNADDILKDVSADFTDYGEGNGKPIKNLDTLKMGLKEFLVAFPDVKGENLMAIADGNHVAVFGDWTGTFKADMGKMKATGKSFKIKDADLYTFNDAGKITEHRSIQSNMALMSQVTGKK